jgi:hypothetical protein
MKNSQLKKSTYQHPLDYQKLMNRVRGLIEKLIKNIEPSARLLSFGSSCNSFGLRNSGEYPVSADLMILEKRGTDE